MSTSNPLTLAQRSDLQANGLEADVGTRWVHPSGSFYLESLPALAVRRQRSDRMTAFQVDRLGSRKRGGGSRKGQR